jgi:hypothetical protein
MRLIFICGLLIAILACLLELVSTVRTAIRTRNYAPMVVECDTDTDCMIKNGGHGR